MIGLRATLPLLLHLAAALTRAENRPSLEELFKWGEYDSLIQALEPSRTAAEGEASLRGLSSRSDSSEEARARLYLGVAYWATGRREEGTRAFAMATRLDSGLGLDAYYATPEIAARYEQIAEAVRRSAPTARGPQERGFGERSQAPGIALQAAPPRSRAWIWWTGAATAAAAGAAAGTYIFMRLNEAPKETITIIDPKEE